ncbi:MAG: 50S ribosomal protein L22 [Candidatus Puniceispirillales bacterium]
MSQKKNSKRTLDNEAIAIGKNIRTSPQKLNLVAQSIRGVGVSQAIASLTFSRRRISLDVKKVLQSAVANAENNHGLDVDKLFVKEAFIGKGIVMKRLRARARGRAARILKPFSRLTIIVYEKEDEDNGSES